MSKRDFRDTVKSRAKRDDEFLDGLLDEMRELMQDSADGRALIKAHIAAGTDETWQVIVDWMEKWND